MVGIPARPVGASQRPGATEPAFQPYAVCGDIPDPIARALNGLLDEVTSLRARSRSSKRKRAPTGGPGSGSGEQPALRLVASRPVTARTTIEAAKPSEDAFMRLSTKGRYAVMAMVDLAQHSNGDPVSLAEIAERQEISLSYLEQLFAMLRKGGLVKSVRGPGRRLSARARPRRDPHRRHHPGGRRADPRDPLHPRRAGRLPRQPHPMSDSRSVGRARQSDPSLSELGLPRRCLRAAACSARAAASIARRLARARRARDERRLTGGGPCRARARPISTGTRPRRCGPRRRPRLRRRWRAAAIRPRCIARAARRGDGVERAREPVAALLGDVDPSGVIFVSGGTEANHLALLGAGRERVLVSAVEHHSVRDAVAGRRDRSRSTPTASSFSTRSIGCSPPIRARRWFR